MSVAVEGVDKVVQKWLLPTLSEVLARSTPTGQDHFLSDAGQAKVIENSHRHASSRMAKERVKAHREWCGAIASLEHLLLEIVEGGQDNPTSSIDASNPEQLQITGLVLAGPVPVLSHPDLMRSFQTGVFTAEQFNPLALMPYHLLPAQSGQKNNVPQCPYSLPLLPEDPLGAEQFCIVFTPTFSLVMVLGENANGNPAFQFSFDPEVVQQAWASLKYRLLLTSRDRSCHLDALTERFPPIAPDYRTVMQFSRLLLKHLPEDVAPTVEEQRSKGAEEQRAIAQEAAIAPKSTVSAPACSSPTQNLKSQDVELLQAFAHEVRTPLTTIRTLTRLLLKRRDLGADIIKRLEIIDHECTEQINRMELIFRAVELETSEVKDWQGALTTTSLAQVLQNSIPHWQKQASRRNLTLDVVLPQKLPAVVSNPAMLDQVLTGLMEKFTRNLPAGGHIQVQVIPAGDQLKLQLCCQSHPEEEDSGQTKVADSSGKSLGQMLVFQPETGNISLNLNATKNLFQALGGKLIVRQRPKQGEVLTIFLPLELQNRSIWNA